MLRAMDFIVEVDGTWLDPRDGVTTRRSASFLVTAPGEAAAETVAQQLFAAAARGERSQTVQECVSRASPGGWRPGPASGWPAS
jgi:hypothetical protein